MNHVYAKHIANKQSQGFVVNGCVPFLKLYDAESHCAAENVPPDKDHLKYDPATARTMAFIMLPELKWMMNKLELDIAETKDKIEICSEKKKRFEQIHTLGGKLEVDTCQETLIKLIERHSTLTDQLLFLRNRHWELYMITRLKGEES